MIDPGALQQTIDFLILQALSAEALQGVAVEQIIDQKLGRMHNLKPGSVFVALQRMERAEWLASEWRKIEEDAGPEKFYLLTSIGKEQLEAERGRQTSRLAQWVESGKLDGSFRKFLDRGTF